MALVDVIVLSLENQCQLEKLRLCRIAINVQEEVSVEIFIDMCNHRDVVLTYFIIIPFET